MSCYLGLASTGRESIPEPSGSPVKVPDLSLELTGISESDSSTLNIECEAMPVIPDGCHVTFTLQDYRRSFNIGTLDRREVFVRMEYDLVDMQSGFHWTNKKVLSTKVMSKNSTISERFE